MMIKYKYMIIIIIYQRSMSPSNRLGQIEESIIEAAVKLDVAVGVGGGTTDIRWLLPSLESLPWTQLEGSTILHLPTHRAGKEEAQPTIVKETAKAKLKSGLGIARMTGSIMANVDVEEKLEREDNLQISLF